MGELARFPVENAMSTRVAEEVLGGIATYKYPPSRKVIHDPQAWIDGWLSRKSILLGWEVVKKGIVKSFKAGKVRHLVRRVKPVNLEKGERPLVELFCSMTTYAVFNWRSHDWETKFPARRQPVVLLSNDQRPYFRVCKNCEAAAQKIIEDLR